MLATHRLHSTLHSSITSIFFPRCPPSEIQFRRNENRDCESHWHDPAGPLGAVGSLCTRAGAIPGYAVERALPKEVITLPAAARPPTSHRNFNSYRSYMLIQNQNRFPTALLAVRRIPKIHIHTHVCVRMCARMHTMTTAVRGRVKNDAGHRGAQSIPSIYA